MGCSSCGGKNRVVRTSMSPRPNPRIAYLVEGGSLAEPQRFDTFEEAKAVSAASGGRVRSIRVIQG
jgi:hypothetical protein